MYNVTVLTPPTGYSCNATMNTGTVAMANVTNVAVVCTSSVGMYTIGGTVSGLAPGDVVQIQDNGGDTDFVSANGTFKFPTSLATGATYQVTVSANPAQPVAQTCTVSNGSGTVGMANVNSVTITCVTNTYTISVRSTA